MSATPSFEKVTSGGIYLLKDEFLKEKCLLGVTLLSLNMIPVFLTVASSEFVTRG